MKSVTSLQAKIDGLKASIEQLVETMRDEDNPDVEDFFMRCHKLARQSGGKALLDKLVMAQDYMITTDPSTGGERVNSEPLYACPVTVRFENQAGGFYVVCTQGLAFFKMADRAREIFNWENLDVIALEEAYGDIEEGISGSLN